MKTSLKILLGAFIGALFLVSCKDQKGKSSSIGDMFEDKISVSMDKDILAVMKNKEIRFYKLLEESPYFEEMQEIKMSFTENIDEISFSTLSSLLSGSPSFFVRIGTNLKMYRVEDNNVIFEKEIKNKLEVDDMNIIMDNVYFRKGNKVNFFQIKDILNFEKEFLLENPNELIKGDDEFLYRKDTIIYAVKDNKQRWKIPAIENIDQVFFSYEKRLAGIRVGQNIKFYKTTNGNFNFLFDFKIKPV